MNKWPHSMTDMMMMMMMVIITLCSDGWMNEWAWNVGGMLVTKENLLFGDRPLLVSLCPSLIPYGLVWNRTPGPCGERSKPWHDPSIVLC